MPQESFDPVRHVIQKILTKKILILSIMWQFLLLAMLALIAFLVIRKQAKKKNPRNVASKQLIEKSDIVDIFGEDLLDTFKTR